MAVDFNVVLNDFIRVARQEVGYRLGQTNVLGGSTVPSVLLSRDTDSTPNEGAYITVDIITVDDSGSWLIDQGVDENDNPFFSSYCRLLLQYTIYGEDSLLIAQELKGKFRVPRVLDAIAKNTGGKLQDVFSVSSLPERLATAHQEVARFNLSFDILDTVTDADTGIIETVNIAGDVLSDEEDESSNTLDLDITVTHPDNT